MVAQNFNYYFGLAHKTHKRFAWCEIYASQNLSIFKKKEKQKSKSTF